jgi:hypothetical protein
MGARAVDLVDEVDDVDRVYPQHSWQLSTSSTLSTRLGIASSQALAEAVRACKRAPNHSINPTA